MLIAQVHYACLALPVSTWCERGLVIVGGIIGSMLPILWRDILPGQNPAAADHSARLPPFTFFSFSALSDSFRSHKGSVFGPVEELLEGRCQLLIPDLRAS